ncbi:MAG: prolyl oligopeptidase family serine peptidase [Acidobacteriota bacterium]
MRTLVPLLLTLLSIGCTGNPPGDASDDSHHAPPPTRVDTVVDTFHGVEIADDYRWLEDQDSPETRAWIESQNAYTESALADRPERAVIERRLDGLMRVDEVGQPTQRGDRYFLWKKRADDDLWIYYVRESLDGGDRALLDPHELSDDHSTNISVNAVSADGELVVYGIRRGGTDETELRILDVESGDDLPDRFPTALYRGVEMSPDGSGFYYNLQDRETGIRVRYHELGTDPADDPVVFGEGYGPSEWIWAELSESGRFLLFTVSHGWDRTELHLQDLEAGGPSVALVDDIDASFGGTFAGDRLFVQTNWRASNGRILEIDLDPVDRASLAGGPASWKDVIPEGEHAIQGFSAAAGQLFVRTLRNVISHIERFELDGTSKGELELPGVGTARTPTGSWTGESVFYGFTSYTTPYSIYRFDVASGTGEAWNQPDVPFDATDFTTEQVWITSKDGTRVPMFLIHRKDLPRDGDRPTLLYGYGGFNSSLTPGFRSFAAVWIEHGGVYAVANLRGGGEFGDAWHKAGMLENKQNVFDDFIAAAEWLIANDYTRPERLAIQGGSNGGLLVGAAMTQRPELFRAVLCQFPDLDMVRYWQFENNNPPALLEYGDASDPEQFKFLHAYSPYQKVTDGVAYPAVMLTSGDGDTRVPPLQARKMTARLQAATSSGRPVFLLYDTQAGHAGGKPLSKAVNDMSLEAAFLFSQVGVDVR